VHGDAPTCSGQPRLNRVQIEHPRVTTELARKKREDEGGPSYLDHSELNSGKVAVMTAAAKTANTPSPSTDWLSKRVEEVEDTVELHADRLKQRRGNGGARAW
jgi:hypothetical protein